MKAEAGEGRWQGRTGGSCAPAPALPHLPAAADNARPHRAGRADVTAAGTALRPDGDGEQTLSSGAWAKMSSTFSARGLARGGQLGWPHPRALAA